MAIRSSSGVSSKQVQSFLSGAFAQAQAILSSQQDEAWGQGQTTDVDYLKQLQDRRSAASSGLTAQNITNQITNLQQTMERKKVQSAINTGGQYGGHKASYVDLVEFEQNLLSGMQPGSVAYESQQNRVTTATNQVVALARSTLNQQIQNGQASPNDLAGFEKSSLKAFQEGTPEYQSQLYNVEDSQRKADQYNYQKTTSLEDAQFQMKLQAAKDAKNVPLVMQLAQDQAKNLANRYQANPQYFTDVNGNPIASFYQLQTKITGITQEASNFATTVANAAASAGKKAFSTEMSNQQKNYANLTAQYDNQINSITKGKGKNPDGSVMDAVQTASALQVLYQKKIEASTAYVDGLNQAVQIAPDSASALQVETAITSQATNIQNLSTQRDNMAKLVQGGTGTVSVFDPSTGESLPTAVNQFLSNGQPDISGLAGKDPRAGQVLGADGQSRYIKGGNSVLSYKNADGTTDQYFTDADGTVMYRQLPQFPTGTGKDVNSQQTAFQQEASQTPYTPLGNTPESVAQQLATAEQAHPGFAKNIGLPDEVQQQITAAVGPSVSVADNQQDNPVQDSLKVQSKPVANTNLGTTLKVIDSNQQTEAAKIAQQTAEEATNQANQHVNVLQSTNDSLTGHIKDLSVQKQSADQLAKSLQDQVNAGNSSLAAQLKAAQDNASKLQSTISGLTLQNQQLVKSLQNANVPGSAMQGGSTTQALSTAGANLGTSTVVPGVTPQPSSTNTGASYTGGVPGVVQSK